MPVKRRIVRKTRRVAPTVSKSKRSTTNSRRRLMPGAGALAGATVWYLGKKMYQSYSAYQAAKKKLTADRRMANIQNNLQQSDNILTLPAFQIGKPHKNTFAEKIAKLEQPPSLHKWAYSYSAECASGQRAWHLIPLLSSTTLKQVYAKIRPLQTDTALVDDTLVDTTVAYTSLPLSLQYKAIVEYFSSELKLINSSTNSVEGNIRVYACKRDLDATEPASGNQLPNTPINHMMYASNASIMTNAGGTEGTAGNGWAFQTSGTNLNYLGNFIMPGSSVNTTGHCAYTDLFLTPTSSHIATHTNFYFKEIQKHAFSLKPGQQVNQWFKIMDKDVIERQMLDYEYIRGVSYFITIDFNGQVVGDSTSATGDNKINTGSGQLSIVKNDKMIMTLHTDKKPKVVQYTSPLPFIANDAQVIINTDVGGQAGYQFDP